MLVAAAQRSLINMLRTSKRFSSASQNVFERRMAMAGFGVDDRIAIAVSGGPDSIALSLLTVEWKKRRTGSANGLIGMIVDHGFRAESANEAAVVKQWLTSIGMDCEILNCTWSEGMPPDGHLQECARRARYDLLQNACQRNQIGVLLTAHHADDQAELFILRLSRSSGPTGLAGMPFLREIYPRVPYSFAPHRLLLARPLLDFSKDDLYEVCRNAGQEWVEDPTNIKMVYARNRIRKSLEPLTATTKREIQILISEYRKMRAKLEEDTEKLISECISVNEEYGYAVINVERLLSPSNATTTQARVLTAAIQFVSQREKPPRGKVIPAVMEWLRVRPIQTAKTAGGCCLSPAPGSKGTKILVTYAPHFCRPGDPLHVRKYSSRNISSSTEIRSKRDHKYVDLEGLEKLGDNDLPRGKTTNALIEAKAKNIISANTAFLLGRLSIGMAKEMQPIVDDGERGIILHRSHDVDDGDGYGYGYGYGCGDQDRGSVTGNESVLQVGERLYFTDRYVVECEGGLNGCCYEGMPSVKVRYFDEKDMKRVEKYLPRCSNLKWGEELERGLRVLKSLPKFVRRGLVVVTSCEEEVIGIPSIGLRTCAAAAFSIKFSPKNPLGGGCLSWL